MDKQTLDISTSTIIRVLAVVLVVTFLFLVWKILASVFLAVVIASALEPAIRGFTKIKIPRLAAAGLVYLIIFLVIASAFYAIIPTLVTETRQLSTDFPESYQNIIHQVEQFFGREPSSLDVKDQIRGFISSFQEGVGGAATNIFTFTFGIFGGILSFLLIFVISFYLAIQKDGVERFLRSFVPAQHQEYSIDFWQRVQRKLGRWFQGQLFLGAFVGTLLFAALWLMDVKYALTIAFMAGIFEVIPVIGPIAAGVVAFVLISFQSPMLALYALIIYLIIEQVQNNFVLPSVMSKTIGLNPIIIIFALLVGAKLAGPWGIVLAIPAAVTIKEFVKDLKK